MCLSNVEGDMNMKTKEKAKRGSKIVALMGAIWLGTTKVTHALQPEYGVITIKETETWYEKLGDILEKLWLPALIVAFFLVGIMLYWKKSKDTKKNKIISIILFLAIVAIIALIVWGCIYFYAG